MSKEHKFINLAEAFNSPAFVWQLEKKFGEADIIYTFEDDKGTPFKVHFEKQMGFGKRVYRLMLSQKTGGLRMYKKIIMQFNNPMRVLATIFAILEDFISEYRSRCDGIAIGLPSKSFGGYQGMVDRLLARQFKTKLMIADITQQPKQLEDEGLTYRYTTIRPHTPKQVYTGKWMTDPVSDAEVDPARAGATAAPAPSSQTAPTAAAPAPAKAAPVVPVATRVKEKAAAEALAMHLSIRNGGWTPTMAKEGFEMIDISLDKLMASIKPLTGSSLVLKDRCVDFITRWAAANDPSPADRSRIVRDMWNWEDPVGSYDFMNDNGILWSLKYANGLGRNNANFFNMVKSFDPAFFSEQLVKSVLPQIIKGVVKAADGVENQSMTWVAVSTAYGSYPQLSEMIAQVPNAAKMFDAAWPRTGFPSLFYSVIRPFFKGETKLDTAIAAKNMFPALEAYVKSLVPNAVVEGGKISVEFVDSPKLPEFLTKGSWLYKVTVNPRPVSASGFADSELGKSVAATGHILFKTATNRTPFHNLTTMLGENQVAAAVWDLHEAYQNDELIDFKLTQEDIVAFIKANPNRTWDVSARPGFSLSKFNPVIDQMSNNSKSIATWVLECASLTNGFVDEYNARLQDGVVHASDLIAGLEFPAFAHTQDSYMFGRFGARSEALTKAWVGFLKKTAGAENKTGSVLQFFGTNSDAHEQAMETVAKWLYKEGDIKRAAFVQAFARNSRAIINRDVVLKTLGERLVPRLRVDDPALLWNKREKELVDMFGLDAGKTTAEILNGLGSSSSSRIVEGGKDVDDILDKHYAAVMEQTDSFYVTFASLANLQSRGKAAGAIEYLKQTLMNNDWTADNSIAGNRIKSLLGVISNDGTGFNDNGQAALKALFDSLPSPTRDEIKQYLGKKLFVNGLQAHEMNAVSRTYTTGLFDGPEIEAGLNLDGAWLKDRDRYPLHSASMVSGIDSHMPYLSPAGRMKVLKAGFSSELEGRVYDFKEFRESLCTEFVNSYPLDPEAAEAIYKTLHANYKKRIAGMDATLAAMDVIYSKSKTDLIQPELTDKTQFIKMLEFNGLGNANLPPLAYDPKLTLKEIHEHYAQAILTANIPDLQIVKNDLTPQQIEDITIEYDTFNKRRHGDKGVLIEESFDVNVPAQAAGTARFQQERKGTEVMYPVFHGTGSNAASMILRSGFRVVKTGDLSGVKTAGKMLGDGIYFSNVLDKVSQYIGNGGFRAGGKGYIFEMRAFLGIPKTDYRSAGYPGATDKKDVISPEWCVFRGNDQLQITKAFRVVMIPIQGIDDMKVKRRLKLNEARSSYGQFNRDRAGVGRTSATYCFADGRIPLLDGRTTVRLEDLKPGSLGRNFHAEESAVGVMVTVYGAPFRSANLRYAADLFLEADAYSDYRKALIR